MPHESATVLQAANVGMTFNPDTPEAVTAIADISFEVGRGEVVAIVGPSGCGKTTLFNIIAGLLKPTRGDIAVDGVPVHDATGHVGYMLQKDLLLPWRTVRDNVTIGLEVRGTPSREAAGIAQTLIEAYGLKGFEDAYPSALSGGMRQRVCIARTLVLQPRLILLDEPFGALDEMTREHLNEELLAIRGAAAWTAFFVTHSVAEAVFLSNRILILASQPGRIHHEVAVPLPYPRTDDTRLSREYLDLVAGVSRLLRSVPAVPAAARS